MQLGNKPYICDVESKIKDMKTEFKNMADRRLVIHRRMTGRLLCVSDAGKLSVSEILLNITGAIRRFAFGYNTHVSGVIQRYIQYGMFPSGTGEGVMRFATHVVQREPACVKGEFIV